MPTKHYFIIKQCWNHFFLLLSSSANLQIHQTFLEIKMLFRSKIERLEERRQWRQSRLLLFPDLRHKESLNKCPNSQASTVWREKKTPRRPSIPSIHPSFINPRRCIELSNKESERTNKKKKRHEIDRIFPYVKRWIRFVFE